MYFCTGMHISVLEYIALYWNTYFCTEIYIFVLELIFLYWNLYFCTGIYIFVLELIFLYWNTYFCTGTYIFVLELIFLYCPCGPPYKPTETNSRQRFRNLRVKLWLTLQHRHALFVLFRNGVYRWLIDTEGSLIYLSASFELLSSLLR